MKIYMYIYNYYFSDNEKYLSYTFDTNEFKTEIEKQIHKEELYNTFIEHLENIFNKNLFQQICDKEKN